MSAMPQSPLKILLAMILTVALNSAATSQVNSATPVKLSVIDETTLLDIVYRTIPETARNPQIRRIEAYFQESTQQVTATVIFEPVMTAARNKSLVVFCRQAAAPVYWACDCECGTLQEITISIAGQPQPLVLAEDYSDELVNAIIGYVRSLPNTLGSTLSTDDVNRIYSISVAPVRTNATVVAGNSRQKTVLLTLLMAPADLSSRIRRDLDVSQDGARFRFEIEDHEAPGIPIGEFVLANDVIKIPADRFVLIRSAEALIAMRITDWVKHISPDTGRELKGAIIEYYYDDSGPFDDPIRSETEVAEDYEDQTYLYIQFPNMKMEWGSTPLIYAPENGKNIAITITDWDLPGQIDFESPGLVWYYLKQDLFRYVNESDLDRMLVFRLSSIHRYANGP